MSVSSQRTCLLCAAQLDESTVGNLWLHPQSDTCGVRVADAYGVSLDDKYDVEDGVIYETVAETPQAAEVADTGDILYSFSEHQPIDEALHEIFDAAGAARLGGASGTLGWSSFSTFMRCPYLWSRKYLQPKKKPAGGESPALVVGSLVHTFLALHYQRMIEPDYPLTVDAAYKALRMSAANQEGISEAWRLFEAYRIFYRDEGVVPLAVEYLTADPRTGESCRYDMIARTTIEKPGQPIGTYVFEHKTAARFDDSALTGWVNDGEVIGQIMLYDRLHLERRFGKLQGVIVNIIGKQKVPDFHRTMVSTNFWQTDQHAQDLQAWEALKRMYTAAGTFPRARANCITKFGKCSEWETCATGECQ